MKEIHDCRKKDVIFNAVMNKWVCVVCKKNFTKKETKLLKDVESKNIFDWSL